MQFAAIGVAGLSLLIWICLFFFNGHFWQIWISDADGDIVDSPAVWPSVIAIVPARNEAATITQTVAALALQDYPGKFSIVVVDDHSEDGTAELAQNAAAEAGTGKNIHVLAAEELVSGWTGKLWALQCGVEFAHAVSPDFIWFTDADVVHGPDALGRLVSRAERDRLDLTSLMVSLQTKTFSEKLIIPPFLYFFLMLYPPRQIANPKSRTAGAAGGCMLLRNSALTRIGGLAAIRSEIIDDCSLARTVKKSGGSIWMGLTRNSVSLRRYSRLSELQDMIARTAFTQLRYSVFLLLGTVAGLLLTFLAPAALSLSTNSRIWLPALLAWCLMSASFLPAVVFYRLSPIWSPFLPIAAIFYSYCTVLSAIRYWLGRGGQWKGRAQAQNT